MGSAELELVTTARAALAGRLVAPGWLHPATGLMVAQHVLAQGATDGAWTFASGVLLVGGCALLWLLWRRRTGVTVGPWTGRRSLLLLGARSLFALVCVWTAAAAGAAGLVLLVGALAVVAHAGTVALGERYDAALRRDLRDARPA